ncbi:hypothetical protein HDU98_006313 [Podochytrium sp. JEL0797]|nr:hypothetical protein HDU98_006313 [Podochytrium sp. JEL0797]
MDMVGSGFHSITVSSSSIVVIPHRHDGLTLQQFENLLHMYVPDEFYEKEGLNATAIFDAFDKNHNGRVNYSELNTAELNVNVANAGVRCPSL